MKTSLLSLLAVSLCVVPALHARQSKLEPGEFEWHPERSPNGPLLVVCSYLRENFCMPPVFRERVNKILTPGAILFATSESSTEKTRSGEMAIGVPEESPATE